jgi:hypothetical protein
MSTLYIRLFSSFFTHKKTAKLRAKIGDDAFWIPPRLWAYAAENQPDGDFSGYSSQELALLLGCDKHATSILQALLGAGFLDDSGKIHDWEEHNGYHKAFSERAKHAAKARWETANSKDKEKDKDTSIAPSMPQACPKHEEAIYEAYPRKVARKNALKAIAKALKSVPHEVLLEKTKAYAASVVGKDPNYIPHPATWFNGERYLDGTETQGETASPESSQQPAKPMTEREKRLTEIRDKMENHPANPYVEFRHGARIPTQEERREFRRLQSEIDRMLIGEAVAA